MLKKTIFRFVLKQIEKADDAQTSQIIQAVIAKYNKVFPGWDVTFLSLPKELEARRKQMQSLVDCLTANEPQTENQL